MQGTKILETAKNFGTDSILAPNLVWVVAMLGGFITNICYTSFLLTKNVTWKLFNTKKSKKYIFYAAIMGLLWIVTIVSYGVAVTKMGVFGLSIGWAIFNTVGIICANFMGILAKEWKNVQRKTVYALLVGLIVLVLGTFILSMVQ
jgi:L-rhamnose-H+ transport protein